MLFCSTDEEQKSAASVMHLTRMEYVFSAVCYRSDQSALDKMTLARPENNAVDMCAVRFCAVCCNESQTGSKCSGPSDCYLLSG